MGENDAHALGRPDERVLFVHAHPDDETIFTGGTIATLVDAGAAVTVLTCTRGERGEVIPAEMSALEGDGPALAAVREGELAHAMAELGVTDQRFLGAAGARLVGVEPRMYVDSGMRWGADGAEALDRLDPACLSAAPLGEVASDVATVIQDIAATCVVSYDANGGYGHPDHIRAHDAALRAAEVMHIPFFAVLPEDSDAAEADLSLDVSAARDRKARALLAHRTQVTVDGDRFALSSGPFRHISSTEHYQRIESGRADDAGWDDLGITARVVACVLALAVGVVLGGIGTVNHQLELPIAGLRLPGGLVAALLLVLALMLGLRLAFVTRILPLFAGVGILLAMAALTLYGPGGSVLVPANTVGYTWSYSAVAVVALVLVWPRIRHSPSAASRSAVVSQGHGDIPARDTMDAEKNTRGTTAQ